MFRSQLAILRQYSRAYLVLNIVFYGAIVAGMLLAALDPDLQVKALHTVPKKGLLALVYEAYAERDVFAAAILTFVVNLGLGSFATITLPSLLIPFSGFLTGLYRAVLWGVLHSPLRPEIRWFILPHAVVLLLEGQAYVLAMLAAYIQGTAFLSPQSVGEPSREQGYLLGLGRTGELYVIIAILLGIAAVYESIEGYFLMPH